MENVCIRDVNYEHEETQLHGFVCSLEAGRGLPTVVLLHDAFGPGPAMRDIAVRIARLGYAVFGADIWGGGATPATQQDIGPLIAVMAEDRERWIERIAVSDRIARNLPESDGAPAVGIGYCFGGSGVLEYSRAEGGFEAAIAVHPGLDLLDFDWANANERTLAEVLVIFGADDPMALPEQWRQVKAGMTEAGVDWELNLYSGTVHAFTSPQAKNSANPAVVNYHPRNAARAWHATERFLREQLAQRAG